MKKILLLSVFLLSVYNISIADEIKESKSIVIKKINRLTREIVRKHSKLSNANKRNVIAVSKFENKSKSAENENIGEAISEIIQVKLTESPQLIILEHAQVGRLLKEVELGMTGLVDEKHAKVAGRLVSADLFLFGSVTELGNYFVVNTRMVEVETAKTLISVKIEIEKKYLTSVAGAVLLEPKSPIYAGLYSAVIPGWGQFYNNHNLKGYLFLTAGVLSIGGLAGFRLKAIDYQDKHKDAANRTDAVNHFDKSDKYHNYANYCFISYAVIWTAGIIDAIISSYSINTEIKQYKQAFNNDQLNFNIAFELNDEYSFFSLNYRF